MVEPASKHLLLNQNGNKNRISLKALGHSQSPCSGARKQYLAPEMSQGAEKEMKTSSKRRDPIKVDSWLLWAHAVRYKAAQRWRVNTNWC